MKKITEHQKASSDQFLKYYDQYSDDLFRFCYHKTSDRELAKDITQETFVKAWEYVSKGGVVDNMRAFLYRTAHNMVVDHFRKKSSSSLDDMLETGYEPSNDEPNDQSRMAEDRLDGQIVLSMLNELDAGQREVLLMKYVEELTISEISDILGEKENTVSVRLHRGLKSLREVYELKSKVNDDSKDDFEKNEPKN